MSQSGLQLVKLLRGIIHPILFTDIGPTLSDFTVMDKKNVIVRSIVKEPKCYVPHVPTPRVPVTEDFGDCSLSSDSSGSTGTEKDDNTNESRVHIRTSSIPRPRAVISSPGKSHTFSLICCLILFIYLFVYIPNAFCNLNV